MTQGLHCAGFSFCGGSARLKGHEEGSSGKGEEWLGLRSSPDPLARFTSTLAEVYMSETVGNVWGPKLLGMTFYPVSNVYPKFTLS